jgi:D-aspartate ligase
MSRPAPSAEVDVSTPAVVLKLDHNVMHHGGLGAIRSLGRLGVPVYGIHEARWAPAASSRYLRGRFIWQADAAEPDLLLAGLHRLADRIGRPAVLIATDDAGAIFLAEHGDGLRPRFLFPRPSAHLPRQLAGKSSMARLCGSLDFPTPMGVLPESLAEATDFAAGCGFPIIAKLTAPWQAVGRIRSTTIVTDQRRLAELYETSSRAEAGLLLQEFIPGGAEHDWFFHGYCDGNSVCRPAFTGRKERSYPAHAGLTCFGRSSQNPRLRDEIVRLLSAISYRGIVDIDVRWDARDGQYKLLDFNPRLGAQFRLLLQSNGIDVVMAQYLDLTGQPIPHGNQLDGRAFLVENYDPLAAFSYWRRGELGFKTWAATLRTVDEAAWFAADDLRPFGLMCLRMIWRLASAPMVRRGPQMRHVQPEYRPGRSAAGTESRSEPSTAGRSTRTTEPRHDEEGIRL